MKEGESKSESKRAEPKEEFRKKVNEENPNNDPDLWEVYNPIIKKTHQGSALTRTQMKKLTSLPTSSKTNLFETIQTKSNVESEIDHNKESDQLKNKSECNEILYPNTKISLRQFTIKRSKKLADDLQNHKCLTNLTKGKMIISNSLSPNNFGDRPFSSPSSSRPSSSYHKLDNRFSSLQFPHLAKSQTFKQAWTIPPIPSPIPSPPTKIASISPLPCQTPLADYFYKPFEDFICTIEPEYFDSNPSINSYQACEIILPKTHLYIPDNFRKNQKFYENILIMTNSVRFQNIFDQVNNEIRYCKVKIFKVLTIKDWKMEPYKSKEFFLPNGQIQKFNYYDYQTAWERTFFKNNDNFSLAFFFYFNNDFQYPVPFWFHNWWAKFGLDHFITPSEIISAKNHFCNHHQHPDEILYAPSWMIFSHRFRVPWILMVEYQIQEKSIDQFEIPFLVRKYKIKWWPKTNLDKCNAKAVDKFFLDFPHFCQKQSSNFVTNDEIFLSKKNQLILKMAACTSEDDYKRILAEFKSDNSRRGQCVPTFEKRSNQGDPLFRTICQRKEDHPAGRFRIVSELSDKVSGRQRNVKASDKCKVD